MPDFNNLTPDEKDSLRSMDIKRVILVKRLISVPMIMLGFISVYLGIEGAVAVNEFSLGSIILAVLAGLTWRSGVVGFIEASEMQKFSNPLEYFEWVKAEKDKENQDS